MNVPKRKMDVILELSYSNFLCESRRLNQLMRDKILLCMGNFLAGVVYFELNAYSVEGRDISRGKFVSKLDEIFLVSTLGTVVTSTLSLDCLPIDAQLIKASKLQPFFLKPYLRARTSVTFLAHNFAL